MEKRESTTLRFTPSKPSSPPSSSSPTSTIIAIQETHWKNQQQHSSTFPFTSIFTNRITNGGGTALLFSPDLVPFIVHRPDLQHDKYFQATPCVLSNHNLITSIYTIKHHKLLNKFITYVSNIATLEQKHLLILGDLNSYHRKWYCTTTKICNKLLDKTINNLNLHIYNSNQPIHKKRRLRPVPRLQISDHGILYTTWRNPHMQQQNLTTSSLQHLHVPEHKEQQFNSYLSYLIHNYATIST